VEEEVKAMESGDISLYLTGAMEEEKRLEAADREVAGLVRRELCEKRVVIEGFLEDGGLTEREEALAQLWLRWDAVAHGAPWPGGSQMQMSPGRAEELRGNVYVDLAASYARVVGRPGSQVRSGAPGGLVLTNEPLEPTGFPGAGLVAAENVERATAFAVEMESEELVEREPVLSSIPPLDPEETAAAVGAKVVPVLSQEMLADQVERAFDRGGAPGPLPGEWHPWLEEFCRGRVEKIDEVQGYVDKDRREAEEVLARVYHRQLLLDGQRMVLGALARGLEEWV